MFAQKQLAGDLTFFSLDLIATELKAENSERGRMKKTETKALKLLKKYNLKEIEKLYLEGQKEKKVSYKVRINYVWVVLTWKERIEFILDMILALFRRKFNYELEAWEDTAQIMREPETVKKIQEVLLKLKKS